MKDNKKKEKKRKSTLQKQIARKIEGFKAFQLAPKSSPNSYTQRKLQ
jgi:hypothetical protein